MGRDEDIRRLYRMMGTEKQREDEIAYLHRLYGEMPECELQRTIKLQNQVKENFYAQLARWLRLVQGVDVNADTATRRAQYAKFEADLKLLEEWFALQDKRTPGRPGNG